MLIAIIDDPLGQYLADLRNGHQLRQGGGVDIDFLRGRESCIAGFVAGGQGSAALDLNGGMIEVSAQVKSTQEQDESQSDGNGKKNQ